MMKHILVISILIITSFPSLGQLIMSAEGIYPDNVCNPGNVFFLIERRAKPVESIATIEVNLNNTITFAKDNPSFTGECAIQFAVNCNGEVGGGFHVVTKSGNETLDSDLIAFFKTIEDWKPGKKNKKKTVDSWYMWRMKITDGMIEIQN